MMEASVDRSDTALSNRIEEEELGIYEDKGSGTDLSDTETVKPELDENNNKFEASESRSQAHIKTTETINGAQAENSKGNFNGDVIEELKQDEANISDKVKDTVAVSSAPSTAKRRAVTITEPSSEVKASGSAKPDRRFSADPALEIRGILKTPTSTAAVSARGRSMSAGSQSIPEINIEPPPPSSQSSRHVDRELLAVARDIEYIQKKCLGNNTRRNAPNFNLRDSPLIASAIGRGGTSSQNVFLYQNRPSPMVPLKAWRGYNGSIYFDPIKINRVSSAHGAIETVSGSQPASRAVTQDAKKRRQQTAKPDFNTIPIHCDVPPRPAIIMDKEAVLSKENKDIQDDLEWIRTTENVGSLKIEGGAGDRAKNRHLGRQNVCKGSVAHMLAKQRRMSDTNTKQKGSRFSVSGDKYKSPVYMNPLLRTSTQYSQSAQRPVTNSPDVSHHSNMDKLPPLEQLRASLRKTDSAKSTNSSKHKHRVSIVDEDNIPSYVRLSRPVPVPST